MEKQFISHSKFIKQSMQFPTPQLIKTDYYYFFSEIVYIKKRNNATNIYCFNIIWEKYACIKKYVCESIRL